MRHGAEALNEHWLVWNDISVVGTHPPAAEPEEATE